MASFLAGATLPDVFGYAPLLLIHLLKPLIMHEPSGLNSTPDWYNNLIYLFLPFHGIIPFVLFSYLVAMMFPVTHRLTIFLNMTFGALLHFSLDFLQTHYLDASYLLFPLSWRTLELGWFQPEASLFVLPFFSFLAAALFLFDHHRDAGRLKHDP